MSNNQLTKAVKLANVLSSQTYETLGKAIGVSQGMVSVVLGGQAKSERVRNYLIDYVNNTSPLIFELVKNYE